MLEARIRVALCRRFGHQWNFTYDPDPEVGIEACCDRCFNWLDELVSDAIERIRIAAF